MPFLEPRFLPVHLPYIISEALRLLQYRFLINFLLQTETTRKQVRANNAGQTMRHGIGLAPLRHEIGATRQSVGPLTAAYHIYIYIIHYISLYIIHYIRHIYIYVYVYVYIHIYIYISHTLYYIIHYMLYETYIYIYVYVYIYISQVLSYNIY